MKILDVGGIKAAGSAAAYFPVTVEDEDGEIDRIPVPAKAAFRETVTRWKQARSAFVNRPPDMPPERIEPLIAELAAAEQALAEAIS